MIRKLRENKVFMILLFLGLFSFAYGLFSNYRELWLDANGLSTISISRIITISSIVTGLSLLFFSLKVSTKKLRMGILVAALGTMITSTVLSLLDGTNELFLIKFFSLFDMAFYELVFSAIYPLILNIRKDDELYTKKDVVDSITEKLGIFLVTFMLGRSIGNIAVDYNTCLIGSIIFMFLGFIVLLFTDVEGKDTKTVSFKEMFQYINKNKSIYAYVAVSFTSGVAWSTILGLKMLTLTDIIGVSTKVASYIILITGILTNILAMAIVKKFKSKNDYVNIFFKYGFRVLLYLLLFITNDKLVLFLTMLYLLLTDMPFGFVLGGYFSNNMEEKYILMFTVLKYCINLLGNGLGAFLCGITFHMEVKYIGLTAFVFGTICYILSNILVKKKREGVFKST